MKGKQFVELMDNLSELMTIYPKSSELWKLLGATANSLKNNELAKTAFEKVIELSPYSSEAHYNLGSIELDRGEYNSAAKHLKLAIVLGSSTALNFYNLALAYQNMGLYERAVDNYQVAINKDPSFTSAINNLATHTIRWRCLRRQFIVLSGLLQLCPKSQVSFII